MTIAEGVGLAIGLISLAVNLFQWLNSRERKKSHKSIFKAPATHSLVLSKKQMNIQNQILFIMMQ